MSQNYEELLEDQIGHLGGDDRKEDKPTTEVPDYVKELDKPQQKKLKYKSSYGGGKEDLSDKDQSSMNDFLERSRKAREARIEAANAPISDGWIPIDKEEMGIRAMFYPESWQFSIRPATVQAIKNWTAIDEERPDVVNKVFNDIVKACVKIETGDKSKTASWNQINSWDRFWFVLKVREYTYMNGEAKIEFEDSCSECDMDIKYNLTSKNLFYEFPDDDLIDKYWNDGKWEIDPKEYDVNHEPITLFTPKLGKDDAIIEWATARARAKQKIDETFVKFLMWMLDKPSKDAQILDRQIQKLHSEYKSWDVEMFSFMNDVINNITINPSEQLRQTCPSCGQEATSTVQFPNGVKTLFEIKSKAKKFGSR